MEMNLDIAIELLEITDISKISESDLPKISRKAKARWHPDRVSHLKDPEITKEYEEKSKSIDDAIATVQSFITGNYHSGQKTKNNENFNTVQPEDVIRENAPEMQDTLRNLWNEIKSKKYKLTIEEVVVSDGFKLKDLLNEDFKEDIAMLAIVSFFYGTLFLFPVTGIMYAVHPVLGYLGMAGLLTYMISCILGFLPLSRFWLNPKVSDFIIKLINFGLTIYQFAYAKSQTLDNSIAGLMVKLMVVTPELFAKAVKYTVLLPSYKLAEMFIGDKIVGVIKTKVNYYAQLADWYIEELLNKPAQLFTVDELFHLSHIYTELSDVKVYYPEPDIRQTTDTNSNQAKNDQNEQEKESRNNNYEYQASPVNDDKDILTEENHIEPEPVYTNRNQNVRSDTTFENDFTSTENVNHASTSENDFASAENINYASTNQTKENMTTPSLQNNKSQSIVKIVFISIFLSVLFCVAGFIAYKQFIEDNPVRDAKTAFNKIEKCNSSYYEEKEKIYNDALNEFVNSKTISSEDVIQSLNSKLVALEAEKQVDLEAANTYYKKLRSKYMADKNAFENFDYAFGLHQKDFVNTDSQNIIPLILKANKILGINTIKDIPISTIYQDLINKTIFGWGIIEKGQITNTAILNIRKDINTNEYHIAVDLKNNQGIQSSADLLVGYNNSNQLNSIKTSRITFKNIAPLNSWYIFSPLSGAVIQLNTKGHTIYLKTCASCPETPVTTTGDAAAILNYSESFQISSAENSDVMVEFSYIPSSQ